MPSLHNRLREGTPPFKNTTRLVQIYLDLTFYWCWISGSSTSGYYFGHFLKQANQRCQGLWFCRYKESPFLKVKFANKGIDALNLSNILNQNPSKVIFHHTLQTRSRHAFSIAILVQMLPTFLITERVCSKSTSIVFPRTHFLVLALALSFFYAPCSHFVTGDLNKNAESDDLNILSTPDTSPF